MELASGIFRDERDERDYRDAETTETQRKMIPDFVVVSLVSNSYLLSPLITP